MKERIIQFDILKGIGILCVLLGHTDLTGFPKELIYGFHMPLFFFCSGVFYRKKTLKTTLLNNVRQLLVPYLFFLVILICTHFVLYLHAGESVSLAIADLTKLLDVLDEHSLLYLSIWFLPCLFIVRLLYAFIDNCVERNIMKALIGLGMYIISNKNGFQLPLFIDTAMSVFIFYTLGHAFFSSMIYKQKLPTIWPLLILIIYTILMAILHPEIEIKDNNYPWYMLFLSTPVVYALYQISYYISSYSNILVKFLANGVGKKSISLLGFHRPLWSLIYPICLKLHLCYNACHYYSCRNPFSFTNYTANP